MIPRPVFLPLAAGALLLALGACGARPAPPGTNSLVITPELALAAVEQPRSLFYNATAWNWLRQKRLDLLPEAERQPTLQKVQSLHQAVQSPKLFRQLDRQYRFDLLLLTGAPSEYRPLLEHLLEAADWKLTYLDHTSLAFRRAPAPAWTPAALAPVLARLAALPPGERALCQAQMAGKLVAVRELTAARELLLAAEKTSSAVPEVWSAWAEYRMAQGEWTAALAAADRALKLDPGFLPAMGAKAQSLYATKRFGQAFAYSSLIVARLPEDPGILFYHAKIAHESRQYPEEIRTLKKLIALAEDHGRADAGYHVYLGQAYAAAGEAEPALAEFQRALLEEDLPVEQRKFAEETVLLIQQKTGARN